MRSSRDLRLLVLLALACLPGITMLRAQETAPAAGPPATEQAPAPEQPAGEEEKIEFPDAPDPDVAPPAQPQSPAGEPAPAGGGAVEEEEEPPPETTPRTPGVVGDTPGRFEPTEKVRADFDVSFPVDI
jgi:hypothetical protein